MTAGIYHHVPLKIFNNYIYSPCLLCVMSYILLLFSFYTQQYSITLSTKSVSSLREERKAASCYLHSSYPSCSLFSFEIGVIFLQHEEITLCLSPSWIERLFTHTYILVYICKQSLFYAHIYIHTHEHSHTRGHMHTLREHSTQKKKKTLYKT